MKRIISYFATLLIIFVLTASQKMHAQSSDIKDNSEIKIASEEIPYQGNEKQEKYKVGDLALGGIVYWIDETGEHGLVCGIKDLKNISINENYFQWCNHGYIINNALGEGIYDGLYNSETIVKVQGNTVYASYAAERCILYYATQNGIRYDDWYLPSLKELDLLCQNREIIDSIALRNNGTTLGNDDFEAYWSSTEYSKKKAWAIWPNTATRFKITKRGHYRVRPIRTF